jgi:gentisate 1,2-dioxygenase
MTIDATFVAPEPQTPDGVTGQWPPVVVKRRALEANRDHLLQSPRIDGGARRFNIVHPQSISGGLAPGIAVSLETLAVGERAACAANNATSICFALDGTANVVVDGVERSVARWDTWTVPSMAEESYEATAHDAHDGSSESFSFLRFSNAAMLNLLGVHWQRTRAILNSAKPGGIELLAQPSAPRPNPEGPVGAIGNDGRVGAFSSDGPFRLEYERLIDPPFVGARSWKWSWDQVRSQLDDLHGLDERYAGRRVCLLYDPATGRTNGTTFNLFASMCMRPAGIIDTAHRHTAAAVNYFFSGNGWSTIGGERVEWSAGDLVFAAPGWTAHHHASGETDVYQMAVQDNPIHLAMGSLLWQESFDSQPKLLGIEPGFTTNRHILALEKS